MCLFDGVLVAARSDIEEPCIDYEEDNDRYRKYEYDIQYGLEELDDALCHQRILYTYGILTSGRSGESIISWWSSGLSEGYMRSDKDKCGKTCDIEKVLHDQNTKSNLSIASSTASDIRARLETTSSTICMKMLSLSCGWGSSQLRAISAEVAMILR